MSWRYNATAMAEAEPTRPEQAFEQMAGPLRQEIKLHCYRMLGSVHEAEDLVQETYLRAWNSFERFRDGSFRAWLYRIATNACLNALESRRHARRFLPDQLAPAGASAAGAAPSTDVPWLEPYPDAYVDRIADGAPTPETRYASREAMQLAFVAAIQQLPPRQRAVLILCDVLGWASAEVATLLERSTASVNSALQRARETLARQYPAGRPAEALRPTSAEQGLLDRYVRAWEGHDLDAFVALLREDATFTMPPWGLWFAGREAIGAFFAQAWKSCGGLRLVATASNAQPAFAVYERAGAGRLWTAHSIHVLALRDGAVASLTTFVPPTGPELFRAFDLPTTMTAEVGAHP